MTDPAAHLVAALDDLRARRDSIDEAIISMEGVLATVYGRTTSQTRKPQSGELERDAGASRAIAETLSDHGSRRVGQLRAGSRAAQVRHLFDLHPTERWTTSSLAEMLDEPTDEGTLKAISAILSRLRQAGDITQVARGIYRAASPHDLESDPPSSPDPESGSTPSSDELGEVAQETA